MAAGPSSCAVPGNRAELVNLMGETTELNDFPRHRASARRA